jgi:aldose 1-epimerase
MKITTGAFGRLPDGREAQLLTFANSRGSTVKVTNYGLIISECWVRDRHGRFGNVVLGFDNLERYLKGHPFFGCIAGRYANRIARGKFTLDGIEYTLATNNGPNHLHGGKAGFDKKLWNIDELSSDQYQAAARFSYTSPNGEEGYPGNLQVQVAYSLTEDDEFRIDYEAVTDQATVLNLTNHSYFNLSEGGDVLRHELQIEADGVTEVDSGLIPTGRILPVKNTPLDFISPHAIGERITMTDLKPVGYDHNFIIRNSDGALRLAATAFEAGSGRVMECHTTQPGVQLWTFNAEPASDLICSGNRKVPKHGGFCLETQHFPDSPNHPQFPSTVLRPGEIFRSATVYRFGAR